MLLQEQALHSLEGCSLLRPLQSVEGAGYLGVWALDLVRRGLVLVEVVSRVHLSQA